MLASKNLKKVGFITKAHGIKGELKIKIQLPINLVDFDRCNSIYVGISKEPVPYLLHAINSLQQNQAIIKLNDINDRSGAESLVKKNIFIEDELIEEDISTEDLNKLIGYDITDQKLGNIGEIIDILETPMQILAEVNYKNKLKLLPLNESTIIDIDHNKKQIVTALPDNILNI